MILGAGELYWLLVIIDLNERNELDYNEFCQDHYIQTNARLPFVSIYSW